MVAKKHKARKGLASCIEFGVTRALVVFMAVRFFILRKKKEYLCAIYVVPQCHMRILRFLDCGPRYLFRQKLDARIEHVQLHRN